MKRRTIEISSYKSIEISNDKTTETTPSPLSTVPVVCHYGKNDWRVFYEVEAIYPTEDDALEAVLLQLPNGEGEVTFLELE
jgi:hypothetical protein